MPHHIKRQWLVISGPSPLTDRLVGQSVPFELLDEQNVPVKVTVAIDLVSLSGHGKNSGALQGTLTIGSDQIRVRGMYKPRPARGEDHGTLFEM